MVVTEQTRYNVHKHLEGTMGEELAATLMEMLPGVGWADVARRRDLEALEARLDARIDRLEARFEALEAKFDGLRTHVDEQFRKYLFATVGITCTIVGLVGAAARFL